MKTVYSPNFGRCTPGVCKHCGESDGWTVLSGFAVCICRRSFTLGYLDGCEDRQYGRTPEHSKTAYQFPKDGTEKMQRDYNAGYYTTELPN